MITRDHELPMPDPGTGPLRGTLSGPPVSDSDLALMRRIDGLDLQHPSTGARLLRDMLKREGHTVRRKHVATPMKRMGIESLYRKPKLGRWHPAHAVYPYLSCNLSFTRAPITTGYGTSPTF